MVGYLQMGPDTFAVPLTLFKDNRQRSAAALREGTGSSKLDEKAYVLVQGGDEVPLYDTDVMYNNFRQEPFFTYLFGVKEPGCYGALEVSTGRSVLFVPRLAEFYATWHGRLLTLDDFKRMYEVDEVRYADEVDTFFSEMKPSVILLLEGVNSDSNLTCKPATFGTIDKYKTDKKILYPVLSECRLIKSPAELEVLKYVAQVSAEAHKKVMKGVKVGMTEYQGESIFLHHSYSVGGCRHTSYTCICGSGTNSAILHYGHAGAPNDKVLNSGDMCLFDMGANYMGYAADITCSFPVTGKFTADQRLVYNAVLAARDAVLKEAREGVSWVNMHKLANEVMLQALKDGGLLVGEIADMMEAGINGVFQPHGLGHLLGLDVHDVGGYLEHCPPKPTTPGFQSLRFARTLKDGMYVTVEPGCYFIEHLLNAAFECPKKSVFLVKNVVERFRNFGGVRIEDDVLIKKDGCENYSCGLPRTVEEIEAFMSGK